MRKADQEEMRAYGLNPEESIQISVDSAIEAWTGMVNNTPICIFGVSPTETPGVGKPWMMGTDLLDKFALIFLRRCDKQIERMHELFPALVNWVAASNECAIKWLDWLGFEFHEWSEIGGMEFIRFSREVGKVENSLETKKQEFKQGMEQAEGILLGVPEELQLNIPAEHRFAEGLYARTLTMPKDTVWASRVHLHENFAFVMTGSCVVVSENGATEYHAPCIMKTERGTKRLLRILEECTWVTVHAIPPELGEDIEKIEAFLAVDTLEEYEQLLLEERKKLEDKS